MNVWDLYEFNVIHHGTSNCVMTLEVSERVGDVVRAPKLAVTVSLNQTKLLNKYICRFSDYYSSTTLRFQVDIPFGRIYFDLDRKAFEELPLPHRNTMLVEHMLSACWIHGLPVPGQWFKKPNPGKYLHIHTPGVVIYSEVTAENTLTREYHFSRFGYRRQCNSAIPLDETVEVEDESDFVLHLKEVWAPFKPSTWSSDRKKVIYNRILTGVCDDLLVPVDYPEDGWYNRGTLFYRAAHSRDRGHWSSEWVSGHWVIR